MVKTETTEQTNGRAAGSGEGTVFLLLGMTLSFVVVVAVGLAIAAIGLSDSNVSAASSASDDVSGAEVYEQNCASCHGAVGEGGIGLPLAGVADRYPDIAIQILIVEQGRGAMPSFGASLSDDQINAVVEFEREELGSAEPAG